MQQQPLDLAAIRARLSAAEGPQYWRGLGELAETAHTARLFLGHKRGWIERLDRGSDLRGIVHGCKRKVGKVHRLWV